MYSATRIAEIILEQSSTSTPIGAHRSSAQISDPSPSIMHAEYDDDYGPVMPGAHLQIFQVASSDGFERLEHVTRPKSVAENIPLEREQHHLVQPLTLQMKNRPEFGQPEQHQPTT